MSPTRCNASTNEPTHTRAVLSSLDNLMQPLHVARSEPVRQARNGSFPCWSGIPLHPAPNPPGDKENSEHDGGASQQAPDCTGVRRAAPDRNIQPNVIGECRNSKQALAPQRGDLLGHVLDDIAANDSVYPEHQPQWLDAFPSGTKQSVTLIFAGRPSTHWTPELEIEFVADEILRQDSSPPPSAASMSSRRSRNGGTAGSRTQDQRIKSPMLYQLSYRPTAERQSGAGGLTGRE
jgi:hypothetical protein